MNLKGGSEMEKHKGPSVSGFLLHVVSLIVWPIYLMNGMSKRTVLSRTISVCCSIVGVLYVEYFLFDIFSKDMGIKYQIIKTLDALMTFSVIGATSFLLSEVSNFEKTP